MGLLKTIAIICLLFCFIGCDEAGQMIKPILAPEITEPTSSVVVVDGKELPVYDTFEQASIHSVTPFMDKDVPQFLENYCRFELWTPRNETTKVQRRFNPLDRDHGDPFSKLYHIILFSDNDERYKMIEYFKGMEGGEYTFSYRDATRPRIIGESRVGSETTFHWERWKVVQKSFTDVVPEDWRDDNKYPTTTYEPYTDPYTGETSLMYPVSWVHIDGKQFVMASGGELVDLGGHAAGPEYQANILMLIVVYHAVADRHSEQCRNLRKDQLKIDTKTAISLGISLD